MSKRHILIIGMCAGLLLMATPSVLAQQKNTTQTTGTRTVKGQVVDKNGEAVIGATITQVGNSKNGTITDLDGNFTITIPTNRGIKVSYIGYVPQTISKFEAGVNRIVIEEDQSSLDEVVVVGYGALKQKNVTGAVEVIDPTELKDLAVSSLSEALIGISPSIHVSMPSTGRPGENATITIRQARDAVALVPTGQGGVANPAPLYVIDDFIYQDSEKGEEEFNNLDVDEVESITILKDAAAAVYGAYGAYGVILVKTKRGKLGTPRISYQGQFGYTNAIKHAKMLDGYHYGTIYNAAKYAQSLQLNKSDNKLIDYFQADELEQMKNMNYDLRKKYWKASLTQRHAVNLNGGTEKAAYFAGLSYYTQNANMGKLDYGKYNYRAGLTANVSNWVKATISVSGDYTVQNQHEGNSEEDYRYLLKNPSYVPDNINGYPIYHSGMENNPANENYYNYMSLQKSRNNRESTQNSMAIQGTLEADFGKLIKPLQGLRARLTYSKTINNSKDNRIRMENYVYRVKNRGGSGQHLYITDPSLIIDHDPDVLQDEETGEGYPYTSFYNLEERILNRGQDSFISRTMSRSDAYQLNFMLMYGRKFGNHDVSGTFSIEKGESWSENNNAQGTHPLLFTDGQSNSLADDAVKDASWGRSEGGSLAYIGRLNYSYADKYLFEFLIRSQASTKFSPENYWGAFPSFSAGWVISEEPWFNKEKLKIDFLKFRASFGVMGRDNVEPWRWLQLYSYNAYGGSIFGTNAYSNPTSRSFQLPEKSGTNPDLHWDTNYKTNFGVDLRMLDSRLSVSLDAYYDMGRDMFAYPGEINLPGTVGIYAAPENYSEMDMWGIEAIVGWRQRINKDTYVSARLGLGYDDNKVKKAYFTSNPTWTSIVKNERTDRGLWGLSCMGMFRSYQQIEEYFDKYNIIDYLGLTKDQVHPGMLIYEDLRGPKDENGNYGPADGKINSTEDAVCISKRANNPYNATLGLNFVWKSLQLNMTFTGNWGAYTLVPNNLRNESFSNMETTNVNRMWEDMFVYEDVYDASGNVIAYQNRDGRWPNFGYTKGNINSAASTFWRMSAATFYLRNITLAYTLPKKWVNYIGLNAVRINATCQNALNLYNPIPGGYWDNFAGTYGNYPVVRKITLGINVTF